LSVARARSALHEGADAPPPEVASNPKFGIAIYIQTLGYERIFPITLNRFAHTARALLYCARMGGRP
jgi:hypothetical protein